MNNQEKLEELEAKILDAKGKSEEAFHRVHESERSVCELKRLLSIEERRLFKLKGEMSLKNKRLASLIQEVVEIQGTVSEEMLDDE
jgi:Mg2+ and Co2+ transporter CorA